MAKRYGISVIVNQNSTGIAGDFDFGLQSGKTDYVTIAHQDDTYEPQYLEKILEAIDDDCIIAFTDYYEKHSDGVHTTNRNLKIKRLLLTPLKMKVFL